MRQIRHPLSLAVYELDGEGHVLVTDRDGRTGTFDADGRWIAGAVRSADPELCGWVGYGPAEPTDIRLNRRFMPVDEAPTAEEAR